ncbi:hypothetical protein BFW01_g6010 [Lasiodiplodia theobromae]|uniref:Uncharacterized protein n=2 Tax=Lasiodiplodia TaxID=66739 RepID=A0A5N5CVF6_9PEZI|nr:uncharacterized protein LTHEOB_4713 [Lasiodiplodia theobromae]KAB2569311.1 hypothetical protein DBV05_g12016 [Lasiodiplodia theobromae]KAF4546061.1 hypothetical protein LTHEOB_4713 [Lasiodiplodia theobromae]KAF9635115.1 hypothetical protein BFW01_g6010 [Lasiodiplodia theobromae]KAK0609386.1 hypothetical protein DIS24_g12327 [Lasiodiplodia hormozganensis]
MQPTSLLISAFGLFALSAAQTTTGGSSVSSASAGPTITSQTATSTFPTSTPGTNSTTGGGSSSGGSNAGNSTVPDVYLNVPELSVGRIELDVDRLRADINLNANVAQLVQINAGVAVSVEKVNITIADVNAELELVVRLGHLVDIVNRVFSSLDLNPLLITAINNVTSIVDTVIGAVDGLLGSITQGGSTLNFLVDNLGNIVQEVTGAAGDTVSSIVGNYQQNMTQVGDVTQLANGLVQKTFEYSPLNRLVDIVFNAAGQVVQATVQKSGSSSSTSSTAAATGTPAARRRL